MKGKRRFGFSKQDDEQIILRRILLNTLMRGPVRVESIVASAARDYGFRREDVVGAARWWNVIEEERGGQRYWRKPDVLAVIPRWNYSRPQRRLLASVVA
jgi:hypothetical protein